ncbi:MAG: hypothetical protein AVO39_10215 [delta proteobacterium MLS_D]|nr:MAG: hypothetical protein AVO39_10215 [delta proteobacterium MLS_D]
MYIEAVGINACGFFHLEAAVKKQIIRVPIVRLESEKHMVYGYASTGALDTYDTRFDPAWWPQAVTGYLAKRTISSMHLDINNEPIKDTLREPKVVGTVPMLEINEKGLWIGAEVTDPAEWERIANGEYNGFSIAAQPFEFREETADGREILVFTKYHLSDITIGYPASNHEAQFQLIERLAYDDSSNWDFDWGKDADAIIAQLGWKGMEQACLYKDPNADPETKAAYKLPVAKMKAGELTIYWNGVRAAMAALNGARGGLDIPESERNSIYAKIKKLYTQFDHEAPELRLGGEITMSTFGKKVSEFVQRLTGKEPDEKVKKEIEDLEKDLSGNQSKQIDDLTASLKTITERIEKIEKGGDAGKQTPPEPETKALETISGTLKKIEERLEAVEKAAAKSQQPGEGTGGTGNTGEKTKEPDVFAGTFFPGL